MIYSRLIGGAGNQLFQYAAGRALADHLGTELILDRRYVLGSRDRGDCFGHFNQARFASHSSLPPSKMDGLFKYIWWRKFGKSPRFARETKAGFNEGFFDLPDETYLHGYWQSPDYFGPDTDALRRDLTLTTALDAPNAAMAAQIDAAPCPVSFHVRRGDYIAAGAYAACTPDYYRAAADHLATTLGKPLTCFIFSNDPAWARDNLDLGQDQVIVDLNDEATGHFDMALMARCAHHVIANSTFSWWGAWLNPDPDKQVVAPRNWFATQALHNPDLIPEQWHRL